ncbi:hypothetical protein ACIGKG_05065 [Streptomyces rochei]|uniref:hypothetical protein n=1 Tax=Streptomyces rochei TaxID=1928 RepID=UPI0037CF5F5A
MTDQTTPLRDRIAAALYEHSHPGWAISFPDLDQEQRDTYLARADAVLAVLPAPADRAAVASAPVRKTLRRWAYAAGHIEAELDGAVDRMYELIARDVRRMADETATTETQARRGDAFEAWLKAQRDDHPRSSHAWFMVDCVLDRYRLHADTGTPLGEHVCEARVVGDCECLEQPAAGARQGGARP